MVLILKSNDENSIAKIINLAKKLNVIIEHQDVVINNDKEVEAAKKRILNFKAKGPSSFGDAAEWEREQRKGKDLPFSK